MPKVIHFEIPAEDPERAVAFYKNVFGWRFNKFEGANYWLASTGDDGEHGIDGAIADKDSFHPTTINTISVFSFEETVEKIKSSGGEVLGPKMAVPNVGYMTYCRDPEGNIFGIMQMDPEAKQL